MYEAKNIIQDLIDQRIINVEQPIGNQDLKIYMNLMPNHGNKGNNNNTNKVKGTHTNVNHVYETVVSSLDEYCTVITIKGSHADCGVTTRGEKATIIGSSYPNKVLASRFVPNGYNVLDQLKITPTQISIMELLKISSSNRKIVEEALASSTIPTNLDAEQFQAMVRNIITPNLLTFSNQDFPAQPSHNRVLHLEVIVQKIKVKRVLVDGGASLNICSLKLIKQLKISEDFIDKGKGITIRAYDDQERVSQGTIKLPIQVGLAIMETTCQVLDLDFPYNILLGCPWIHVMKVVASTFHQCVKFTHEGQEVTIHGNLEPFSYCKNP